MNAKFNILGAITLLLYSCQNKNSLSEEVLNTDSLMKTKNIEQQTLKKWFSFNRESDSIITSAELIIIHQEKGMEIQGKNKSREKRLHEAKYHLEELKRRVNYIKEYEISTDSFNSSVVHTLDSLQLDYLQEKLKLEASLCEFQEFTMP
ncbi:hypothetical protein [Flavobacterium johnsoniae]|jgi:hypothetical protein|uniref:Uncharacterized protein n=1 Tax=Flavobacterium johnsoniae TaxID=986 RepID=A0A1J7BP92_FLAJO|nr:hypothetical protein [Flavobacterium johnsoniae]OIV40526.1 hypothetical protein BKM63_16725 [Flavobacterium johnsoniae]